jgi:hypothetical protein
LLIEDAAAELFALHSGLISLQIVEEFKEIRKQPQEKDSEGLLSRKETCEFLKISLTTLWQWTNKGKINSYGIGNRVYYKKVDLLNSLVLIK